MTGQILRTNNANKSYKADNHVGYFENFIVRIVEGLNDIGMNHIAKYYYKISLDERTWASGYLLETYKKLKSEKYDDEWINRYLITKTIAILSLWAGYLSEGGKTPPPMDSPPAFNYMFDARQSTFKRKNTIKATAVIPTRLRYGDDDIFIIKEHLLKGLIKSSHVGKILLIGNIKNLKVKEILSNDKIVFIEIDEKNDTPSYARNVGIDESISLNSEVTLFIDDDVHINPENIDKIIHYTYISRGMVLPLVKSKGNGWLDLFHDYDGTLNGVYYENRNQLLYATTCCVGIFNEVFLEGLRFDEDFKIAAGEDIDFSIRALYKGFPIIPNDEIIILHDYKYPKNREIDIFIKRYFRYGRGNAMLIEKHPYYYSLLSKCRERPTLYGHSNKDINTIKTPKEVEYLRNVVEVPIK